MTDIFKNPDDHFSPMLKRAELERDERWIEMWDKIPYVPFRRGWKVAVIPPFAGAVARFRVRTWGADVSVYLDTLQRLGYYPGDYWEIYPSEDGRDVDRYAMDDVDGLVRGIAASIRTQQREAVKRWFRSLWGRMKGN